MMTCPAKTCVIDHYIGQKAQVFHGSNQRGGPSVVDMIAMNGQDPEARVIAQQRHYIHKPLVEILGSDARADLFWAVIIGCCVTQNSQSSQQFTKENAEMLRYMLQSAASFGHAPAQAQKQALDAPSCA